MNYDRLISQPGLIRAQILNSLKPEISRVDKLDKYPLRTSRIEA